MEERRDELFLLGSHVRAWSSLRRRGVPRRLEPRRHHPRARSSVAGPSLSSPGIPLRPAAGTVTTRAAAIAAHHARLGVDRVGDPAAPRLPGPSPGRGGPWRARPYHRPASRRASPPSPADPSCSSTAPEVGDGGSMDPFLFMFFFRYQIAFWPSWPAAHPRPSTAWPGAAPARAVHRRPGGPIAARSVFFYRLFSFTAGPLFKRPQLSNRKSVLTDSNF